MGEEVKRVHSSFWANIFNPPDEKNNLLNSLKSIPLFEKLNKRDISNLTNILHHRNYLANEFVFYQGDPGIGLYIIREGEVSIIRENDRGDKIQLATFSKGDFFGELALVDGEKRSASAITKADCQLAVIFKPDLDEYIEKYPRNGIKILRGIAQMSASRLRAINEEYFSLHNKNLTKGEVV